MFRDWQEKRIAGGVTIVAAGHCVFYLYLLFSCFKTGAERSFQTDGLGYGLVELMGNFLFVVDVWRCLGGC